MAATFTRLHLATRIHFGLMRSLGEGIDVARMLRDRGYAEEVLNVCRGLEEFTLVELADRFDDTTAAESARACMAQAAREARRALAQIPLRAPKAPQEMAWSAVTSGFGLTRAMAALDDDTPEAPQPRRFSPTAWFGSSDVRH